MSFKRPTHDKSKRYPRACSGLQIVCLFCGEGLMIFSAAEVVTGGTRSNGWPPMGFAWDSRGLVTKVQILLRGAPQFSNFTGAKRCTQDCRCTASCPLATPMVHLDTATSGKWAPTCRPLSRSPVFMKGRSSTSLYLLSAPKVTRWDRFRPHF